MLLKELYYPNVALYKRLRAAKNIIAIGMILSIATSWRLWTNDRFFPQVPMFNFGFEINNLTSYILFGLFGLSIVGLLVSRFARPFVVTSFVLGIVLVIIDQNRLQPWFYMYMIMLFVLCFYNWRVDEPKNYTAIYTSLTLVIGGVYLWSGIQKLNPNFMSHTWTWFIKPLESILTPEQCTISYKFGYAVPFMEIAIGIGLFFEQTKKIMIPLVITMHVIILVVLSPLFHNYNPTVWGWNFAMILLVYVLFAGNTNSKYKHLSYLVEFKPIFAVAIICFVLPVFNLFNKWDSYLSANLYSGNTTKANIYLSKSAKSKLPYYIQHFVKEQNDNLYELEVKTWALNEIGIPGYPEKRMYEALQVYIQKITCCDDEITLFINEKNSFLADS